MTLLLNHELSSRVKLCLVSVFPNIVKDCAKIRNLLKNLLKSLENVAFGFSKGFFYRTPALLSAVISMVLTVGLSVCHIVV